MWLSDTSVKRPVLATVVSLIIFVVGMLSFEKMSLREYPNVDPPIVTIDTKYLGASAQVVENRITKIIENRISGVSGIKYIESSSSDGRSKITIEFNIERDIDSAANDIRDRVSRVLDNLPDGAEPPEVEKADGDESVIMWFNLNSDRLTVPELTDYAERYLVDRFSVLNGVGRVRVGGGQSYAIRIWLDPTKMALNNLTAAEVEAALRATNLELPIGVLQGQHRLYSIQVNKPLAQIEDLEQLVVKQSNQTQQIKLVDIAKVELGTIERRRLFRGNGQPMVGFGIIKQSNANTLDVARLARERKDLINQSLPEGMQIANSYDSSVFVEQAVNEVYKTLFIALGLVVIVMLLFLKSWRAAIIPMATLPVALVGTFVVLWGLGFSVNLLTLLALVLAIGLVVDDAIVVLENTKRHIDLGHKPISAAYLGTRQVGFAIIATTLVLISVFLPMAFLEGKIGRLFSEFAITLAVAVVFSSWVALTFSPALASLFLKAKNSANQAVKNTLKNTSQGHAFNELDNTVNSANIIKPPKNRFIKWFKKLQIASLRKPWIGALAFVLIIAGSVFVTTEIKQEYVPKEDRGVFFVMLKGPEGATFDYMQSYAFEIEKRMMPLVENGEVKRLLVRTPRSFGNTEVFNSGIIIVVLEDWAKRRPANEIMAQVRKDLADLTGVKVAPVMRSSIGGRTQKPVKFVIGGPSFKELGEWQEKLDNAIDKTNPGLTSLDWDYEPNKPQLRLNFDYEKATALGVSHRNLSETLQVLLGGKTVTTFDYEGEEYDIYLKAEHQLIQSPQDLQSIYLRSETTNKLLPLTDFIDIKTEGTSSTLNRYNRVRAITLSANLEDDLSLSEALNYLTKVSRETLPAEAVIDYKGQSRDFFESSDSFYFVFLFGFIVIYLVLAAQFESFMHPFIILFTVPLALAGGVGALYSFGVSVNIYSQIALLLLLGLATKNGILIVEFANQIRDTGISFYRALISATALRLRPIVMTSITTVVGTIPLIFSMGAGSESRYILGIVLFWGVLFSMLLSLWIIPLVYSLLAKNTGSPLAQTHKLQRTLEEEKG